MAEENVIPIDQPEPKFNLDDLAQKLSFVYNMTMGALKNCPPQFEIKTQLQAATGQLQELVAIVDKCKRDMEVIDVPTNTNQEMLNALETEKIQFHVVGVQYIIGKRVEGIALYTTVPKARKIRDILNQKFAELRVDQVAKIINYPVY